MGLAALLYHYCLVMTVSCTYMSDWNHSWIWITFWLSTSFICICHSIHRLIDSFSMWSNKINYISRGTKSCITARTSEVLVAVTTKNTVLWDVMPCSLVVYRRFGGTYCLCLHNRKVKQANSKQSTCCLMGLFLHPEDGGIMFFVKITFFWEVTSCNMAESYERFLYFQDRWVRRGDGGGTSSTEVTLYQSTRRSYSTRSYLRMFRKIACFCVWWVI
jgi:hypothetical protein